MASTTVTPEETETDTIEVPTLMELGASHERFQKQAAEQVVNPIVLADMLSKHLGKLVRPQMIYNYIRKGTIAGVKDNNTQKFVIPLEEAQRWVTGYLTRLGEKQLRIEKELAGATE